MLHPRRDYGLPAWSQGSAHPDNGPYLDQIGGQNVANNDTCAPPPPRRRAARTTGPASRQDSTRPGAHNAARPPLRRQLSTDCWSTLECWWSAERWVAEVDAVYRRHYLLLRPALVAITGGGLSRVALVAVATAHAAAADFRTGRSSRPQLGETGGTSGLTAATKLGARTVTRARTFLRLAGLATEVAPGRHRTRSERLDTWTRGHRTRGWCADYALHPSRTHLSRITGPVDNSSPIRPGQRTDGTPPRSGLVLSTTHLDSRVTTAAAPRLRGATRQPRTPTRQPQRHTGARDPGGLLLARRWLVLPGTPTWARNVSTHAWASLLAIPAAQLWTARDLNQLIATHAGTGRRLLGSPRRPIGYLSWLLTQHGDLQDRPCALDDAREAAAAMAAAQERARQDTARVRHQADRAAGVAALGGAGHAAARRELGRIASRAEVQ